ncbi:transposase [Paenactinomyces guangxiensis]|uniref:Transposase n=1 Tax=Paenactinomyces guangxiensis TaxID=1490290 RepID=A0A7W2A9B4_9BACL|nr:transposase [Paenactinomyces guangxiensis]MBA4495560.1 transposase [Paenactinomyces guangxiensis]MBH8592818.1 transposase [Paenactinomyces guangxiensis]
MKGINNQIFCCIEDMVRRFAETPSRAGKPKKFSDTQILKCLIYQAYYRIHSFRELEWKLNQDHWTRRCIGLDEVPDHSTFCRRAKQIEQGLYAPLYEELLFELEPKTRVCYWDSTALRASRYDRDAEKGKGTRLGWFYGYKLHAIVSEDLIPLVWDITPANLYDNQCTHLIYHVSQYPVFMPLADAAYDDHKLFSACNQADIHLVTPVNKRNASCPAAFQSEHRQQNWRFVTEGLGKKFLSQRSRMEQLFSTLKTLYGLEQPRRIYRYYRHTLWVILLYLLDRLINKRLGFNTSKAPWNR